MPFALVSAQSLMKSANFFSYPGGVFITEVSALNRRPQLKASRWRLGIERQLELIEHGLRAVVDLAFRYSIALIAARAWAFSSSELAQSYSRTA